MPRTLTYRPATPGASGQADARATWSSDDGGQGTPGSVSVFYPTGGQSGEGSCWMGLSVDRRGNLYPVNSVGIYRIRRDGRVVNGVDDRDFFATGHDNQWATLDEDKEMFFAPAGDEVRAAPFEEGSTFSPILSGLTGGIAITVGRGPLAGSLFVTEPIASRVSRVSFMPLGLSTFSSGEEFFSFSEAIASAPDGTLYVVNRDIARPLLIRIATDGTPSIFAEGTNGQFTGAVAVDEAGNVFWSRADGFAKYDASGRLVDTLPPPPDKPNFGNPMGSAFDRQGNLYVVDNFGCKRIYKYARVGDMRRRIALDIKPGHDTNKLDVRDHGKVKVAILTTDDFDATQVDADTVRFGRRGTEARPKNAYRQDVNGDGRPDKVLCFEIHRTDLTCHSASAMITGRTRDGSAFQGTDSVTPTGCCRK
ncbi:hypothetical protein [Archangium sp.]|uniref:hypothetical protein n=1 Tax=Archangium sp. TaxID=1872627 RepID=UPI003899E945